MEARETMYEGKSKRVLRTDDPTLVILEFKDDATAFNGVKKAQITDKGRVNNAISVLLTEQVQKAGIASHFVKRLDERRLLVRKVEIVPVEVVVRNVAAGSFAKRYAVVEGTAFPWPLVEFFYKSDVLGDPLISEDVAVILGWARRRELTWMKEQALRVNEVLKSFFSKVDVDVIDFKLEFGRTPSAGQGLGGENLVLADEITPDGMRLWERGTGKKLDKDVFRRDLGDLSTTYRDLYQRLFKAPLPEVGA